MFNAHRIYSYEQIVSYFQGFELKAEDNIAIMLKNCPDWVFAEQAALSLGMVVVPLYTNDRPDNVAYILDDANIKLLIVEGNEQVKSLTSITPQLQELTALITLEKINPILIVND